MRYLKASLAQRTQLIGGLNDYQFVTFLKILTFSEESADDRVIEYLNRQ